LKNKRRTGVIDKYTTICLDFNKREIKVFYDGGRLIRPLLIVQDNKLGLTKEVVEDVQIELAIQLPLLTRKDIAKEALNNSCFIIMEDETVAFNLLNEYAAEHLIIASDNAMELSEKVINAGSVFLGHYSPESVGDYASGTNHTLPTNGYAKAYSGVSLDSFVKKITFQHLEKEGLKNIGPSVETMAAAEGLDAHKNAVTVRIQ
jgi:histidinol dehydrogenase